MAWVTGIVALGCVVVGAGGPAAAAGEPDAVFDSYLAHIAAAEASLRLNEPTEAARWLSRAPERERGWEWAYLDSLCDESTSSFEADPKGALHVEISPDGKTILTCGNDGVIHLWDRATRAEIRQLKGHASSVYKAHFSPDGALIASASHDRTARIWDAASGECLFTFKGHGYPVADALFTPDGSGVISCSYTRSGEPSCVFGEILLWNRSSGEVTRRLVGGVKPLSALALSRDGKTLAAGSWDAEVYVYDLASDSSEYRILRVPDKEEIYAAVDAVAISPDGALVACGSKDRTARVWNLQSGELVGTLGGHGGYVGAVAFSPDGATIVTGSRDDSLRLWNTSDFKERALLRGHRQSAQSAAFTPDGSTLYSAGLDGDVRQWDPRKQYGAMRFQYGKTAPYAAHLSPDGALLLSGAYDGTLRLWNSATGAEVAHWPAHPDAVCCTTCFSADGKRILSCGYDKTLRIFDTATQKELARLEHPEGLYHCAFSPDNVRVAAALTTPAVIWVWDSTTNAHVGTLEGHEKSIADFAYSPDGARIASAARDGTVRLWDAATFAEIWSITAHDGEPSAVAFSPDGSLLATGGRDGAVMVWDARSGILLRTLLDGDDAVNRLAFSPDGTRIAAAGNAITLLDALRPGSVLRLRPHEDTAWHLSWSADGKRLATCSWDGTVVVMGRE